MKKNRAPQISLEQEFLNSLKSLSRFNKKAEEDLEAQLKKWEEARDAIENAFQILPGSEDIKNTFKKASEYITSAQQEYEGEEGEMLSSFEQIMNVAKELPGIFSFGRVNIDVMEKYASAFNQIKELPLEKQAAVIKRLGLLKIADDTQVETMFSKIKNLPWSKKIPLITRALPLIGWAFNLYFGIYYFFYAIKDFISILEQINRTGLSVEDALSFEALDNFFEENKDSPERVAEAGVLAQTLSSFITDVIGTSFNIVDFIMNSGFAVLHAGYAVPYFGVIAGPVVTKLDIGQSIILGVIQMITDIKARERYSGLLDKIRTHIASKIGQLEANIKYTPRRTNQPPERAETPRPSDVDGPPDDDSTDPPDDDSTDPPDDDF